MTSDKPQLKLR